VGNLSGAGAATGAVTDGFQAISGLSGVIQLYNVGQYLVISGSSHPGNNGAFQIVSVQSATQCTIANPNGVSGDTGLAWHTEYFPTLAPAPVIGSPNMVFGPTATASMHGLYTNAPVTFGILTTATEFTALRPLVRLWKSATTFYPWFIVSFGGSDGRAGSEFSPNSSEGSGNADGTWGSWGKVQNGFYVSARNTGAGNYHNFVSFVDGTGIYQDSAVFIFT
jgi:hypothetical protein